ncbi:hypothetical protein MLD38_013859 [Melastoma candidum]|uniref:Uncharacterized protein n=1 Tax=Melastoma candidum TaxID=119954 RepID=A0ACB9RB26_9MYRT|nr:hypothetical protein MLD38_013859 [Melastoma candidum]
MGLLLLLFKKFGLLYLLLFASTISSSMAGRSFKTMETEFAPATVSVEARHEGDVTRVHERVLKVNTNDYGKYDPAPALVRPPFKLIPN